VVSRLTAALLAHVGGPGDAEVLLVHPGGPFWARKDEGAWSIPKGLVEEGEEPLAAALREFAEEIGAAAPDGPFVDLGTVRQRSGKVIHCFAVASPVPIAFVASNTFELEWPKGSGVVRQYPEVDRAEWFSIAEAREKLLAGQLEFLERLLNLETMS
jgi:predicted NUDIX family NTP pyrophosphohydrolase